MESAILIKALTPTKQRLLGHIILHRHNVAYLKDELETGYLLKVSLSTVFTSLEIKALLLNLPALQMLGLGPATEWYT